MPFEQQTSALLVKEDLLLERREARRERRDILLLPFCSSLVDLSPLILWSCGWIKDLCVFRSEEMKAIGFLESDLVDPNKEKE